MASVWPGAAKIRSREMLSKPAARAAARRGVGLAGSVGPAQAPQRLVLERLDPDGEAVDAGLAKGGQPLALEGATGSPRG